MSQNEFDDEFAALLGDEGMAEVDAMVTDDPKAAITADAAVKVNTMPAPAIQEAKQAAAAPKPSIIGKKRQLLVPQVAVNKRKSVQMQSPTSASDATALASKDPSPSPAPAPAEAPKDPTPSSPAPAPAEAAPEAAAAPQEPKQATTDPEPSAASSPTKAKSPAAAESADDTKATPSPSEMEADKDEDQVDTDMADAAPADEPEVQSPLKKAPAPEASADKPSTAAASGGAPSSRAKLVVKPAASTAPSAASKLSAALAPKPTAAKPKAAKPAAAPKGSNVTSSSAAAGGGKAAAAAAGLKMPKAQTAFMFFSADTRRALKETEPGLSMPEMGKRCGEMWRELSEEEKKPYHDMAQEDKERVNLEIAAMDPDKKAAIAQAAADRKAAKQQKKTGKADKAEELKEAQAAAKEAKKSEKAAEKAAAKADEKAKKQAAKAAKEAAVKKEKDGFKMFHSSQYATVKADNPGKEAAEINALVQSAWDQMDQAEKDAYMKKAEEAAEAAAAARAMDAKKPAKSKGSKSAGKRSKKASAGTDDEAEGQSDGEGTEATYVGGTSRRRAAAAEDEDDDSDCEDVDWESHPSEYIMTHGDGAFQVAREGLMLTEYGKVDTLKAKERLLLGGAGSSSQAELPVSGQQVEEYEKSCQKFWTALKSRMTKDSLYLEELEEGSPLELCYVLGKLQEKGMVLEPKTKYPKGEPDILRRLPVMRLSMVVQRLLDMERSKAKQAVAKRDEVLSAIVEASKDNADSEGLDKAVAAAAALLEGSA